MKKFSLQEVVIVIAIVFGVLANVYLINEIKYHSVTLREHRLLISNTNGHLDEAIAKADSQEVKIKELAMKLRALEDDDDKRMRKYSGR